MAGGGRRRASGRGAGGRGGPGPGWPDFHAAASLTARSAGPPQCPGGPAARRGQRSAGLSPRKLAAGGGRFGLGRLGPAAMMRRCRRDTHHVCCLLIRDGRWACRPGHGPGPRWRSTGGRIAGQGPSREGQRPECSQPRGLPARCQVLPAARAGSCISGGACGEGRHRRSCPAPARRARCRPGEEVNRASHPPKRAAHGSRYTRPSSQARAAAAGPRCASKAVSRAGPTAPARRGAARTDSPERCEPGRRLAPGGVTADCAGPGEGPTRPCPAAMM